MPAHLRDSHYQGAKVLGHGAGYEYPHEHDHDELGAWIDQQYLPDELRGRRWYEPSRHGHEQEVAERMSARHRDTNGDAGVTAGELALVVGAVLCALAFAALAVTLVRVHDTLGSLRAELAEMRAETTPLLAELRTSADDAAGDGGGPRRPRALRSRARFGRGDQRHGGPLEPAGPYHAVGPGDQGGRSGDRYVTRGPTAAEGRVIRRVVWFAGGVAAGAAGAGYAKRKVSAAAPAR